MTRLLRFCAVGATGVLVNSAVLFALVHMTGLPVLLAASIATEVAILYNFTLNDRWTFRAAARRHGVLSRILRYNAVSLGGLLISVSVLTALVAVPRLHYLVANLAGIGIATVWNFGANARVTWAVPLPVRALVRRMRIDQAPADEGRLAPVVVREREPWT